MELLSQIPEVFLNFLITLVLSLLIGLEQKKRSLDDNSGRKTFGTDRSFTFIGIFGFILYILSPVNMALFITGAVLLGILLGIFYFAKIRAKPLSSGLQ